MDWRAPFLEPDSTEYSVVVNAYGLPGSPAVIVRPTGAADVAAAML